MEFREDSFSVIIVCKTIDADARKCFERCFDQTVEPEIFIVDDEVCSGLPATKRNWAMERASGEYLAFIDADAYPPRDWLKNALFLLLATENISAVCGAGILPPNSPPLEVATDWVLRHLPYSHRVVRKPSRMVAEFPTFNLIVRRKDAVPFENYLTGEDSLFCRSLKGGVFYHPDVFVYHRRRPLFRPFWKQTGTYGLHRGHLIRLALLGWLSVPFVYGVNFVKGFLKKRVSR